MISVPEKAMKNILWEENQRASAVPMDEPSASTPTHFNIRRSHFQPGYDIEPDKGGSYHAEMDFCKLTEKLTLRALDDSSAAIAVSHMPWTSRIIHVGFNGPDDPHGSGWEDLERVQKLPWEDIGREEYQWRTSLAGGEKTVQLLWIDKAMEGIQLWGMGGRSYTLMDTQKNEVLAECITRGHLYTGGVLELKESWRCSYAIPGVQVLMTFLAIYELGRRKAHWTVYGPLK